MTLQSILHRAEAVSGPALPATQSHLSQRLSRRLDLSRGEREGLDRFLARSVRAVGDRVRLIEQGAVAGEISVVLDGWAGRYRTIADGRRQLVALHVPGDVCDFDVFMMQAMDSTIEAIGPLKVAGFTRDALNALTRDFPRVGQGLWWASLANAAVQREWMVNIASRNGTQRIAHLACELFTRLSLVGLCADHGIDLPLTQADLGAACGMTPEHTNRTLRALRTDGLLAIDRRRLTILDPVRLVDLAKFDAGYLHAGAAASPLPECADPAPEMEPSPLLSFR